MCVKNRECLFGTITDGVVTLSPIGEAARKCWLEIPRHYPVVQLDEFVIMPNHIHGIIKIMLNDNTNAGVQNLEPQRLKLQCLKPQHHDPQHNKPLRHAFQKIIPRSLGAIIRGFKIGVTKWCTLNNRGDFTWQRNYFEEVVRDENGLQAIRQYIINNPSKWDEDLENPFNQPKGHF